MPGASFFLAAELLAVSFLLGFPVDVRAGLNGADPSGTQRNWYKGCCRVGLRLGINPRVKADPFGTGIINVPAVGTWYQFVPPALACSVPPPVA